MDDWLSVPAFVPTPGEHLEELATYSSRPVRAAARAVLAAQAASLPTRPAAILRGVVATVLVAALIGVAVIASGGPHSKLGPSGRSPAATSLGLAATPGIHRPAVSQADGQTSAPAAAPAAVTVGSPAPSSAEAPELAAPPGPPVAAPAHDPLPVGKGAWIAPAGGDTSAAAVHQLVAEATGAGLTHLFVATGSSMAGFTGGAYLDQLLPAAHAAGLRVIGWDTPGFADPAADARRAAGEIRFSTPSGQHLDGLVAAPGLSPTATAASPVPAPAVAAAYASALRKAAGPAYPLIAAVTASTSSFPYAQLLAPFDAVAAVVDDSASAGADPATVVSAVGTYGKPVLAVGEFSSPPASTAASMAQVTRFISASDQAGAVGVSFWSAQATTAQLLRALTDAPQFDLLHLDPSKLLPTQIRAFQAELASLGYQVPLTGILDAATTQALATYQQGVKLLPTGVLNQATQASLLAPLTSLLP